MPTELRWVWSLSRSRVIVTWKPPISTNGLITEYEIKYCNRRDEVLPEKMRQCKRKMMRLPSPLKGLPHRIPLSLQAPARYEVKIAARNKIGGGPYAVLDIILKEAIGVLKLLRYS